MITASSSPKRRILAPEHGHAYGVRRYLLSSIEQAYGSGIVSFFFRQRFDAARGPGAHRRPEALPAQSGLAGPGKSPGNARAPQAPPAGTAAAMVNVTFLLSVLVDMSANTQAPGGELPGDPDAAIRQLYSHYASALHAYVEQFCPDRASADDIVQETFIRAWRHLPQLSADDRPVRPWLFRVARNLLIDANRAARARPMTVPEQPAGEIGTDSGMEDVLDRQLVSAALAHLSPAHQSVLVETFYRGGTMAAVARELGIPHGTARSRLHYALDALRQHLAEHDAIAS
jgi:RNA polymerase sigma-70 factor (ECF subfamily)